MTIKLLFQLASLAFSLLSSTAESAKSGQTIPLPDMDRAAIEKYLGDSVVVNAIPAPAIADTSLYLAAKPGIRKFRLVSGPDAGKTERHQVTRLKQEA
ncbi:MAG: hypothetical protein PHI13_15100, partial [Methylococcales bacterium]|nr:hypothetical protein [Methylococcales bacterium]